MCNVCNDTGLVKHPPMEFVNRDGATVRIKAGWDACPECTALAEMLYKNALTQPRSDV